MRDSSQRHHAQHLAPLRDLDAEQPLGAERERDVVAGRVQIILAVGPRDDLVVLAVLADLLEAAVQIADVRNAAHHRLAVELEHQAQHAVRRRMLRPDVDEHVLTLEIGLDRRRLGSTATALPALVDRERHALRPALRIEAASSTARRRPCVSWSPCLLARPFAGREAAPHVRRQILERLARSVSSSCE